jgi:hypothetical protein
MAEITVELEGKPAWSRERAIGHYGGAVDKQNSDTEGLFPYAWSWYQMLQSCRGSAYRKDRDGLVHSENLAIARSEAARTRAAEKLVANSQPLTSDEKLDRWVETLNVKHYTSDTLHDLRLRCASKYKAGIGPTIVNVDEAVETLLGDAFVRTWRQEGTDLANPPTQTYWPGVNPGPAAYDLGGGTWLSERCHLVVEVQQPDSMTLAEFLELTDVHLFQLLDRFLPSWATFNWSMDLSDDGFTLDIDDLDFKGMIP